MVDPGGFLMEKKTRFHGRNLVYEILCGFRTYTVLYELKEICVPGFLLLCSYANKAWKK